MQPVCIVGGGPAGLMAATEILRAGHPVVIFEQKKSIGRKFLVAGDGGFNLTHSEPLSDFAQRYREHHSFFLSLFQVFSPEETRQFWKSLGIPTFVGSSGRVFPERGIRPTEVLQKWRTHLEELGCEWQLEHELIGFDDQQLQFQYRDELKEIPYEKAVFALGGGSWPQTGSTGKWMTLFEEKGIATQELQPSNCGWELDLPAKLLTGLAGKHIKNISLRAGEGSIKGELSFTAYGWEGTPAYGLTPEVRGQLGDKTRVYLDLKPMLEKQEVLDKLRSSNNRSRTEQLKRQLKLDNVALQLIKALVDKEDFQDDERLVQRIKKVPVDVCGLRPIKEAISTSGGVSWKALNPDLSLKQYAHVYIVGEMIDWDTRTGGYLLQGAFSMGAYVGKKIAASRAGV